MLDNAVDISAGTNGAVDEQHKWSYACGESTLPLVGTTIGKLLETAADKFGSRDAFVSVHQNLRYSHKQFLEQSDNLAAGLLALGLNKGDRVGIWSPNCMEWIVTQFATARVGMVLVCVNPSYRALELEYAMRKVGVKVLVVAESLRTTRYHDILLEVMPEMEKCAPGKIHSQRLPDMSHVIMLSDTQLPGTYRYRDVLEMATNELRKRIRDMQDYIQFDEPINIQFTSGTTGRPKGVTLTHHGVINNARFTGRVMQYDTSTRVCLPVPLYHCFGMVLGNMTAPVYGGAVVLPAPGVDAKASLQAIQQERCTALYGTPTMFIDMLAVPNLKEYDLTTLYTGIMSGSVCPLKLAKDARDQLHMPAITMAYGTTETSSIVFQTALDDASCDDKLRSTGTVFPHTEAKIMDKRGRVVQRGAVGELCVRSYGVTQGYWNDPDRTAEAIGRDRWYRTGDMSVMDDDGYVQIVGRCRDMFIRGGENIYPVEIEQFLYTHPQIEDVQVVGVPDKRLGEDMCAWIKLKDGESTSAEEVRNFCKGQISYFKIPRYIEFVTEFPTTVTGKIQKFRIREIMEEKLRLLVLDNES